MESKQAIFFHISTFCYEEQHALLAGFIDLSWLCGEAEEVHGDANVVGQDIPGAGSSRSPPWQGVMAHGVLSRWRWPYLDLHHFFAGT